MQHVAVLDDVVLAFEPELARIARARFAVERDAMSALLVGGGVDLAEVGQMFTRLTENHQRRMARMGLSA